MSVREEFEKAFDLEFKNVEIHEDGVNYYATKKDVAIALWAARWAMDRCAQLADETAHSGRSSTGHRIRKAMKELDQK